MDQRLSQKIFGVLNLTEDSFFDGACYFNKEKAIKQGLKLIAQGAGVLDIGAASSHPTSKRVTAQQEIKRLEWVLGFFKKTKIKISIDSCLPEVQLYAIRQGVDFLNDICGFSHPEIYEKLAASSCKLVLMHSVQRASKADRRIASCDIVAQIQDFFGSRLEVLTKAGIARERIILDTGLGFFLSLDPEISFEVLQNIQQLKRAFQLPLLLGVSRKSFLQKTLQKTASEVGAAGAYLETLLFDQGVDYIRTHSPEFLHNFLLLKQKIKA